MATRHIDELKRDAVHVATIGGLTRTQVSSDLGVGLWALYKRVQKHQCDGLMSGPHEDVEGENERLRNQVSLLREDYPSWSSYFFPAVQPPRYKRRTTTIMY